MLDLTNNNLSYEIVSNYLVWNKSSNVMPNIHYKVFSDERHEKNKIRDFWQCDVIHHILFNIWSFSSDGNMVDYVVSHLFCMGLSKIEKRV